MYEKAIPLQNIIIGVRFMSNMRLVLFKNNVKTLNWIKPYLPHTKKKLNLG